VPPTGRFRTKRGHQDAGCALLSSGEQARALEVNEGYPMVNNISGSIRVFKDTNRDGDSD